MNTAPARSPRVKAALVIVPIAALLGILAFTFTRSGSAPEAAAPESAPAIGRTIPETLPDFTLATLEGPPRALSSFDHPSLIVNFWATWCAPCRREIPLLRQLRAERGDRGVEVVGVAVDFREDVVKYAADIGSTTRCSSARRTDSPPPMPSASSRYSRSRSSPTQSDASWP